MTDEIKKDTVDYNDPTPFDGSKLQSISDISKAIRHKMNGQDVREPIAQQGEALVKLMQETGGNQSAEVAAARGNHELLGMREDAQDNAIDKAQSTADKAQSTADSKFGKADGESYLKSITVLPETFANLAAIKAKYPNGKNGLMVAADNGHKYIWANNVWTDAGVYQSAGGNKLYSILPTRISDWDSLKVVTTVGSKYSYNSMPTTADSSDQHYYTSMPNYGLYSRLMVAKGGSDVTLIGSTLRYVSLIEYDANLTIVAASEWKEARTLVTLNAATAYIIIAVKNKNNSVMTLSDVAALGVDVLSETLKGEFYTLPKPSFSEADWLQGFYNLSQGESIGDLTFSDYRLSTIVTVKPSTEYIVNFNKEIGNKKYQASIELIDSDGTVINNSGWIKTKDTVALRTSTSTVGVCVMVASRNSTDTDDVVIRPADSSLISLKIGDRKIYDEETTIDVNNWKQGNIGGSKGKQVAIGQSGNRIYTSIKLQKNTTYLINMNAPIEYQFNFVQTTDSDVYLYDTYWRWGEYRLQTSDTDEYLYIVASLKNDADLAVDAAINFKPKLTEISPLNSKLDTITANKMIMHRGASQVAPEDTIPAIMEAARTGKWATEMDVQYTSDGVPVIMHDLTIDRTTTGTGAVAELTLEEIKAATVDFGANIDKYPNLKVPTLEESITACKRYGIIPVLDCGAILQDNDLAQQLVIDLKRLGIEQRCIILTQGTDDACNFRYYNQITPLIVQYYGNIDSELEARRLYGYREAYLGGWNFDRIGTTDEMLMSFWSECHKLQLQVYAITNDKDEAERFIANGCDFISSDDLSILQY